MALPVVGELLSPHTATNQRGSGWYGTCADRHAPLYSWLTKFACLFGSFDYRCLLVEGRGLKFWTSEEPNELFARSLRTDPHSFIDM